LLLVLPLYAIAVVISIRSELFRFKGAPFSNSQLKAAWTFLAAGLAATATVLGALLTKSHNDRTLALQSETERRQRLFETETNERLSMDSVINGLELMCRNGEYSPKAITAGGLATLVQLGHPIVAMRALAAAMPDGAVDDDTATWLISQVLTATTTKGTSWDLEAAKEEAANLLYKYAPYLTDASSENADFSWPDAVTAQWPEGLPQNASLNILAALVELLLSQRKEWWKSNGQTYSWISYTIDEALTKEEKQPPVRMGAAILGKAILDVTDDSMFAGMNDARERLVITENIASVVINKSQAPTLDALVERIQAWGQGEATSDPPSQPSPVSNP
jgi:hypothetical protein